MVRVLVSPGERDYRSHVIRDFSNTDNETSHEPSTVSQILQIPLYSHPSAAKAAVFDLSSNTAI